jgi:pimeloyl-ACP methyl ester carboxylesterase
MAPTLLKMLPLPSGTTIFYREQQAESNDPKAPVFLLMHGFPSSSFQFRNLIPLLAVKYRVIAPDFPAFGFTEAPADYVYTFENLTKTFTEFVDALKLTRFSMYVFDYGAPIGYRFALTRPSAIEAIVTQNGNAYTDGFGDVWGPIKELWASNGAAKERETVAGAMLTWDITKFQYLNGESDPSRIAPETYTLDYALLSRPGNKDKQLDLFVDYQNNAALYDKFHEYFRTSQVPLLAIWGKNDVFFIPPGAEAYKKDLPNAKVKLLDAGHFAGESHTVEIAQEILDFFA